MPRCDHDRFSVRGRAGYADGRQERHDHGQLGVRLLRAPIERSCVCVQRPVRRRERRRDRRGGGEEEVEHTAQCLRRREHDQIHHQARAGGQGCRGSRGRRAGCAPKVIGKRRETRDVRGG